ncbi:hypothetical protein PV11_04556 [Exophiala sideris]|uniref:Alpha/beta hydrolase fold-3 domain-containing protein n=1 Tax=Exophiala sideris TaxID=1016849 RepID=A0A0D1Z6F0_9EURO|nr:hypothetical protein PV11_04556 [Exophiala sideris]
MAATFKDKALLVPAFSLVIARALLAFIASPFRGKDGAPTVSEHVINTALRTFFLHTSVAQLQLICPPFVSTYEGWCKKRSIRRDIVDIPNTNAKGFWIGSKDSAKYHMVYFHGGGFVMPGLPPHIDFLWRLVQRSNGKLAVFAVAYTLAPKDVYPLQIGECVEALRYVLSLPGRTPHTTLLGGDSAGGPLLLAVLGHVSGHPHPQSNIVRPLDITGKLCGAIAMAPMTSCDDSKFKSLTSSATRDSVHPAFAKRWLEAWKGGAKDDEYIVPESAPASWWSGTKVSSMLVTVGEDGILHDPVISFVETFKRGAGEDIVTLVVGKRECHVAPLRHDSDSLRKGSQEAGIKTWITEILK